MPKKLIDFTDDQIQGLRQLSQQTGTPVSRFVRQAVSDFLSGVAHCTLVIHASGQANGAAVIMDGGKR